MGDLPVTTTLDVPPAGEAAPRRRPGPVRPSTRLGRSRSWSRRAPLLPALIFIILLTQLPFVGTIVVSFMKWNSLLPNETEFGGFHNYAKVLTNPELRGTIFFTVKLTAIVVVISMILGFAIALIINERFFGRGIVRTLIVLPFLFVTFAGAFCW